MNKIQDEQWIDALPEDAVEVAEEINIEIAKVIAKRIKSIGKLSPSDAHKLSNSLQYLGADFGKITKLIAKLSDRGQMAVVDTLQTVADANDEFAKVFYSGKGLAAIDWHSDPYLHNLVEAMARQTATDFTNLSNTLAYKIDERTLPLRQMYTRAIDKAIYEVHSGTVDYYTAMRKTVRQLSNDMRVVKWDSGYVRRLDSHVRQNLLDGVKQLNQQMLSYHGEKFGADGVELSAHAISAPDHAQAQGRQFSNEEFEKMQTGQPFEDVKGNEYNAFRRPIGEWNCRHIAFPIIIGISQPAHTDEELRKLEENSAAKYESTQVQRALETKLRKLKNQRMVFSAAGDELEAKRTQKKINELQAKYRKFSEKQNLAYQPKRATVEGYRRISVKDLQGQSAGGSSHTSSKPQIIDHIDFTDKTAIMKIIDEAQNVYKGLDYEVSRVVTSDGNVWEIVGTEGYVDTGSISKHSSLMYSFSYHNHPEKSTNYSFSGEDVGFFISNRQAYSKASDSMYEYIMRRTDKTVFNDYDNVASEFKKVLNNEALEMAFNGAIEYDFDGYHETMKIISQKYKFEYERHKK